MIDFGLYLTYFLFGAGALAAILFPVFHLVQDPKSAKNTLMGIGILLVIVVIGYLLADNSVPARLQAEPGTAKMVGTGLMTLYILFIGAIAVAIYSEVTRLFK